MVQYKTYKGVRLVRHLVVYLSHFGYYPGDYVPCEDCTCPTIDIHHIIPRGMGGDIIGQRDVIENLVALCRTCHDLREAGKMSKEDQQEKHLIFLAS